MYRDPKIKVAEINNKYTLLKFFTTSRFPKPWRISMMRMMSREKDALIP